MDEKRAGEAAVLSFIFSGVGQIYNGHIKKGLLIVLATVISIIVFIFGASIIALYLLRENISFYFLIIGAIFFTLGLFLICVISIYSINDAYKSALNK